MQTRYSDEKGVCPSVCLSNAWIVTKWKKHTNIHRTHTIKQIPFCSGAYTEFFYGTGQFGDQYGQLSALNSCFLFQSSACVTSLIKTTNRTIRVIKVIEDVIPINFCKDEVDFILESMCLEIG